MRQTLIVAAQIAMLMAICELGYALASWGHIPLPGNLLGMVILYALLASGALRLQWIEAGSALLLKHLAFFFVPIAVGLMGLGELLRSSGWALLIILFVSAAAGIVLAGRATQSMARRENASREKVAATRRGTP